MSLARLREAGSADRTTLTAKRIRKTGGSKAKTTCKGDVLETALKKTKARREKKKKSGLAGLLKKGDALRMILDFVGGDTRTFWERGGGKQLDVKKKEE